jgi:hypothetical protein
LNDYCEDKKVDFLHLERVLKNLKAKAAEVHEILTRNSEKIDKYYRDLNNFNDSKYPAKKVDEKAKEVHGDK